MPLGRLRSVPTYHIGDEPSHGPSGTLDTMFSPHLLHISLDLKKNYLKDLRTTLDVVNAAANKERVTNWCNPNSGI